MAKEPEDTFSFSRRYFHLKKRFGEEEEEEEEENDMQDSNFPTQQRSNTTSQHPRKKFPNITISRIRSALSLTSARAHSSTCLGTKVVGTVFGHRHGHVHFAFQEGFKSSPAFLVEMATPTSVLVKEMASGQVRIAFECDKKKGFKLLEEPIWRGYCNGKKCGYAMRRECGPDEWKVLNTVGSISMGAGVLIGAESSGDGEMMYMRARFERVVGSKDSEAFYMVNPDGNGCPELSIFLLRV